MISKLLLLNNPIPRHWYALGVVVCVDVPLGASVRSLPWPYIAAYISLMVWITARRFFDCRWSRWWAIPYSLIALSPYYALHYNRDANLALVTVAAVLMELPAMLSKSHTAVGQTPATRESS